MRKNLKEYFEAKGVNVANDKAYGVINGYEVNYFVRPMESGVGLFIPCYATQDQRNGIDNAIKLFADKFVRYEFNKYGLWLALTDWTGAKLADRTIRTIDEVCAILSNNGALGAGFCPVCGMALNADNSQTKNIDGVTITLDNDCISAINDVITRENTEFDAAPNNYLKGFCGALIGGVAGALIAIILNIVGFYAGISSFVAFFVGVLLYKKFGGKPNKMMIVIVTATTFVMMIVAVLSIYLVVAGIAGAEVNLGAFEAFSVLMEDKDFSTAFIADMAMTLLFTVVGCVSEIVKTARDVKRSKNI